MAKLKKVWTKEIRNLKPQSVEMVKAVKEEKIYELTGRKKT